ncbi:MAG: fluoride efflux transporter CrcB [Silvibacterium sp.]|nr:fluoride efflux transporter CrcB [Silvibacterium sp.]
MQKFFYVALGGALGSLARFWIGSAVGGRMGTRFPYGTFVINISACIIIGFVLTVMSSRTELNPAWRFLIAVGFVGSYSTFSTFEWEIFSTMKAGAFLTGASYMILSLMLGLAGVWGGVLIARAISE